MPLTKRVLAALGRNGHRYVSEPSAPTSLRIERRGTAYIVELAFSTGTRRKVVVKELTSSRFAEADRFLQVHDRVRCASPVLARVLPRCLGTDAENDLLVTEFLDGVALPLALREVGPRDDRPCPVHALEAVSEALRELHKIPAALVSFSHTPRQNASFVGPFESEWASSPLASHLRPEYRKFGWLGLRLPSTFFSRVADQLVLVDAQPKNVIVGFDGVSVGLIDLAYEQGSAAMSVSGFLAGLGLLDIGRPFRQCHGVNSLYGRSFLAGYSSEPSAALTEEILFFYPWVIFQLLKSHVHRHPLLKWYLARVYGELLNEFLDMVHESGGDFVRQPDATSGNRRSDCCAMDRSFQCRYAAQPHR